MVLASPSASQTCRLASDFKACFDLNDNKLIIDTAYFTNGVSESLMKFRNLFLVLNNSIQEDLNNSCNCDVNNSCNCDVNKSSIFEYTLLI